MSNPTPRSNGARVIFAAGAFQAGLGVMLGAFGAHILRTSLAPGMLAVFETGVRYQMYHAFGLFAIAWASVHLESSYPRGYAIPAWCFIAGTILFSGSLYMLSITGISWIGAITPIGGLLFIGGWIFLGYISWRSGK